MRGLAIVLLAGCDVSFGLQPIKYQEPDASIDGPPDAAACMPRTLTAQPAIEDTQIYNENNPNPSNRYGGYDTIDLGLGGTSRVLLRFAVTAEMMSALAPTGAATMATLVVTIRTSGGACGAGCTSGATTFEVFAANNYWNEGSPSAPYYGAAWHNRMQTVSGDGVAWAVDGADGTTDRSLVPLGTGSVQAGASGVVTVTMPLSDATRAELSNRISGTGTQRTSLLLVPITGGTLFLYTREGGVPARLTLTVCQ